MKKAAAKVEPQGKDLIDNLILQSSGKDKFKDNEYFLLKIPAKEYFDISFCFAMGDLLSNIAKKRGFFFPRMMNFFISEHERTDDGSIFVKMEQRCKKYI